ncbi:MAG: 2-amino-4-hydroxy-6-hydroxymethyldihydropteridine diphosphokinase [Bacteroides sp.]|nr:2-amino-4-hydroxy-6-hydroxymethyldihydropteridine diphosphokinase [Bacteroides sp.]MCM1413137.1 2-amino-4-hydroxy-6-hydroxymethyldihydropteridine diphosphokinase [Bacteroides sp.]MCM1472121.1 2-amino-4-hydroxy-6-hydroxymethyldihydropteridine diphosphokinase [Bacteroides sp.]
MTNHTHRHCLSIGSNTPDGRDRLLNAINELRQVDPDLRASSIYNTPSVSTGDNSLYFNCVVLLDSDLSVEELQCRCKQMESANGRIASDRHQVPLDIDIVVSDDCVLRQRDYQRSYFLIGYHQILRLPEEDSTTSASD